MTSTHRRHTGLPGEPARTALYSGAIVGRGPATALLETKSWSPIGESHRSSSAEGWQTTRLPQRLFTLYPAKSRRDAPTMPGLENVRLCGCLRPSKRLPRSPLPPPFLETMEITGLFCAGQTTAPPVYGKRRPQYHGQHQRGPLPAGQKPVVIPALSVFGVLSMIWSQKGSRSPTYMTRAGRVPAFPAHDNAIAPHSPGILSCL